MNNLEVSILLPPLAVKILTDAAKQSQKIGVLDNAIGRVKTLYPDYFKPEAISESLE